MGFLDTPEGANQSQAGLSNGSANGIRSWLTNGIGNGISTDLPNNLSDSLSGNLPNSLPKSVPNGRPNSFTTADRNDEKKHYLKFASANDLSAPLSSTVDILIIGSGPAGLTIATQLAQIPGIRYAILEREQQKLQKGHADGLQVRSLEMFEALGFAERVRKEAYYVNEMTFWEPDGNGGIYRASRAKDTIEGISDQPHVILTQARLHDLFLERMAGSANPLAPSYGCSFKGINKTAAKFGDYHEVLIEQTTHDGKITERTVHTRYIIGCDGARSAVRSTMGLSMQGDRSNSTWGVMDALADTNFPDIRRKVGIRSANEGAILIIPKAEEDHNVSRVYAELDPVQPSNGAEPGQRSPFVTEETIIAKAQKIFHPYTYDVKRVLWWSKYEIGQRLCERFDNSVAVAYKSPGAAVSASPPSHPTIFIAGDACHTHSPKAGQGMNMSMADTFNLGWKLASVILNHSSPSILDTYNLERHSVAAELIDFDKNLTRIFSSQSATKASKDELAKAHADKAAFTAGVGITYSPSMLTAEISQEAQALAKGFPVGQRLHSARVLRCSDVLAVHLNRSLPADGRWRIIIFAGADLPGDHNSRTWGLCEWLASDPASPLVQYTPVGTSVDSVIEVLAVYQASHADFDHSDVHDLLWPKQQKYCGARDYKKVFTSWWDCGEDIGDVYEERGVDKEKGAVLVVRPDQYVANVLGLDEMGRLGRFFDGFMLRQ